jgi:hypothetical protein
LATTAAEGSVARANCPHTAPANSSAKGKPRDNEVRRVMMNLSTGQNARIHEAL